MKKTLTALTLVLLLLLGLLPGTALAAWDSFRGSPTNMAVTDAPTPTQGTARLKWAAPLGSGYESPVGVPILTDDAVVVMAGTTLYKLDPATGDVLATGAMSATAAYANAAPAYAQGTLFCALDGGVVEAFDAATLESRWVYTDDLGGQNQVPVTYSDGLVFTGFWSGETETRNYICLDAATGQAQWAQPSVGGYYWAGAVVVGDAVIFGGDNGQGTGQAQAPSTVYALDARTGEVISTLDNIPGDQRSSIAYSAQEGRIYFTTKAGYLCSAAVDGATGALSDLKTCDLGSATTATPVVYGGRVYLTAASIGFGADAVKQNFIAADAHTLEVLYTLPMPGYPQCSLLLSTAYLDRDGVLCFYSTYNALPGGITLITAAPDGDSGTVTELYDAAGYENYCICSLICDDDGTLYYKNDSGNLLAVGKKSATGNLPSAPATMTVTVGAYDYNAVAAGLDGASQTGVIFEETVTVPADVSAADAVQAAARAAGVELAIETGAWGPYLTAIGGLASGTGGGYSGWTMVHNGAFPDVGLGGLTLAGGDTLAFHYSVNPDMATDDVGSGQGLPVLSSFTLAGVTASMKKETTYDENWVASTSYFIQDGDRWTTMEGEGTEDAPFRIPLTLPAGTKLTALEGRYTTQLGERYHTVIGLEGKRDYTDGLTFRLSTVYGDQSTYYKVDAAVESSNASSGGSSRPTASGSSGGGSAQTIDDVKEPVDTPAEAPLPDQAPDAPKVFADVPSGHWAGSAVDFVTARGLFAGTSQTDFSPDLATTRGMVMTVLARLAGTGTDGGQTWYEKAMTWAVERGISDGTDPQGTVTREQLAVMLWRYASCMPSPSGGRWPEGPDEGGLADFSDASQVSPWAAEGMRWAVQKGILTGKPGGLLDPGGSASRAEVAVMVERFVTATES